MKSTVPPAERTVFAVTLGCPKNRVDTEFMLGDLLSSGYALVDAPDEADVVVVNTCGFLASAREESIETLSGIARAMKNGARLVAAGCMVELFADQLRAAVPTIDLMVRTSDFGGLAARLEGGGAPAGEFPTSADPRLVTTTGGYAYLKVADGCDRRCSYCIIPNIKGRQHSRPVADLVAEARGLASNGVRELVLIAQDLTRYGADLRTGDSLVRLIRALEDVDGIEWVRLMYLYPDDVTDELLDAVAESRNCLPYFDIPIQHGDDAVLTRMKRGTRAADIVSMVERIRTRLPGAVLRTTLMTGFPGETDEEFENMMALVRETEFDMVGVFEFSAEPGSAAALMPDQVPPEKARARRERLEKVLSRIAERKRRELTGRFMMAVAEYVDDEDRVVGRLWFQAPEVDGETFIEGLSGDDESVGPVLISGFEDGNFFARRE